MNIPNFHLEVILPTNHDPISLRPIIIRVRCASLSTASGFPVSIFPVFQHSNCQRSDIPGSESFSRHTTLARMFHELLSRDREDGTATGQPEGVALEAYLNGTSQGTTPEETRKDGHIRGRSRLFMKHPG